MGTYYCVTSSVDNRGRVTIALTGSMEAVQKPDDTFSSTSRKDIYNDWFDTYDDAIEFTKNNRNA